MRRRRWWGVIGVVLAVTGSARVADATPGATTGNVVRLGRAQFGRLLVDAPHGHVFVSETDANVVIVLDMAGNRVGKIRHEYGAAGMVVVGDVLYIAQSTTGRVDRVDANTFARLGPIARGLDRPFDIAYTGGLLWTMGAGEVVSVSVDTGQESLFGVGGSQLATSPGAPATLFTADQGLSPGTVYRYDVSSGTPHKNGQTFDGSDIADLTVSADGKRLVAAHGSPYEYEELRARHLVSDGVVYPGQAYPDAVASTTDATAEPRLATGEDVGSGSDPSVQVFKYGRPAAIFGVRPARGNVEPHGLALTPAGDTLYIVTLVGLGSGDLRLYTYALP